MRLRLGIRTGPNDPASEPLGVGAVAIGVAAGHHGRIMLTEFRRARRNVMSRGERSGQSGLARSPAGSVADSLGTQGSKTRAPDERRQANRRATRDLNRILSSNRGTATGGAVDWVARGMRAGSEQPRVCAGSILDRCKRVSSSSLARDGAFAALARRIASGGDSRRHEPFGNARAGMGNRPDCRSGVGGETLGDFVLAVLTAIGRVGALANGRRGGFLYQQDRLSGVSVWCGEHSDAD